jgi:hypothetical protein
MRGARASRNRQQASSLPLLVNEKEKDGGSCRRAGKHTLGWLAVRDLKAARLDTHQAALYPLTA